MTLDILLRGKSSCVHKCFIDILEKRFIIMWLVRPVEKCDDFTSNGAIIPFHQIASQFLFLYCQIVCLAFPNIFFFFTMTVNLFKNFFNCRLQWYWICLLCIIRTCIHVKLPNYLHNSLFNRQILRICNTCSVCWLFSWRWLCDIHILFE